MILALKMFKIGLKKVDLVKMGKLRKNLLFLNF